LESAVLVEMYLYHIVFLSHCLSRFLFLHLFALLFLKVVSFLNVAFSQKIYRLMSLLAIIVLQARQVSP